MQKTGSSIKKKTFIVFLISSITLSGLYVIYTLAFQDIYKTVGDLTYPTKKLSAVNDLFFEINKSEKSFRTLITTEDERSFDAFLEHSSSIIGLSDSLRMLCMDNRNQLRHIDSINHLIEIRKILLLDYLKYRKTLAINNPMSGQMKLLDSIISTGNSNSIFLVQTNEQKKTTTRVDTLEIENEPENKSLWNKIFKRQKKKTIKLEQTEKEDIKTKIDTIKIPNSNPDSGRVHRIFDNISKIQKVRRSNFLSREAELNEFEKLFNNKINELLSEVEKDVISQTASTQFKAENTIAISSARIGLIMAVFFLSSAIIVFLIMADVTKSNQYRVLLEKAKEDAEFQSLAKQRFLSNMSHEIRTPLQSIIGYSEQLKEADQNPEYIRAIQHSSEHLLQVVNEILDYSRINSAKFSFEKINFNIAQVVGEVLSLVKLQAQEKDLELQYSPLTENYVSGDPFRLKQVLLNLLGNAVKFTDKGSISLKVSQEHIQDKENYTFTVSDTGIGIPWHMQERIFEQFEQLDLPIERRHKGTGLGLSISRLLVEGQGGEISVESEAGKGSRFTFNVPYDTYAKSDVSEQNVEVLTSDHIGEVWLVDDDRLILQLCSDILSRHNIKHLCFNSARSLLQKASAAMPSMVLADIRMPEMSGMEVCRELRNIYADKIKIIALTAHALPDERNEILRHGFDHILMKPFRESGLMALFRMPPDDAINDPGEAAGSRKLNVQVLEEMVGNDPDKLKKILTRYISETTHDIQLLHMALEQENKSETRLLLHRISGRTSQIGAKELGTSWRKLEIRAHQDQQEITAVEIRKAVFEIEELIKEINGLISRRRS